MGMFDELTCKYELPIEGATDLQFQTKDTSAQMLDQYEIRGDGTLWHEEYDIEDRSNPDAIGVMRMAGAWTKVNKRWVPEAITDTIYFYTFKNNDNTGWIEFCAEIVNGHVLSIKIIENRDQ